MAEETLACLNKLVEDLQRGVALDVIMDRAGRLGQAELAWRAEAGGSPVGASLRDMVPAAVSLSKLQLGSRVSETTAAVLRLGGAIANSVRALAACRAALVVLNCTAHGLHRQECQLELAVVLALASCASVALGPALQAVQLLCSEALKTSAPASSRAWEVLEATISIMFKTAVQAAFMVVQLRGRDPAPALLAGVCRPDKVSALCHQLAPILVRCREQGVDVRAALEGLCHLLVYHSQLGTADRVLQDGPATPALASLALQHYASQCLWLLSQPHGALTVAGPSACSSPTTGRAGAAAVAAGSARPLPKPPLWLQQYPQRLALASYLLHRTKPWQELKVPGTVVTHVAAAVLILQRLTARGLIAWATLEGATRVLMDLALALLSPAQKRGQKQQQNQQQQQQQQKKKKNQQQQPQQQQQQQQDLTVCLEAATLSCAVVARTVETRVAVARDPLESPETSDLHGAGLCFTALAALCSLMKALVSRLQASTLSSEQLLTALAAAEAAVRLAACLGLVYEDLLKFTGSEQVDRKAVIAQASSQLLAAAGALIISVTSTLSHEEQRSSTGTAELSCRILSTTTSTSSSGCHGPGISSRSAAELESLARHVSHLAASSFKLGELQAESVAVGNMYPAISIDLCLDVVSLVVLVHSLQSRSCDTVRKGLLDRQVTGTLNPLLDFLVRRGAFKCPGVVQPDASWQDRLQSGFSNMEDLAGLLAKLDTLPCSAGLLVDTALVPILRLLWQALQQYVDELPDSMRQLSLGAPGIAAGRIAKSAVKWRRLACLAVTEGILNDMAAWAEKGTRTEGRSLALVKGLQDAWMLFVAVASQVVAQTAAGTAPAGLRLLHDMQGLPPARQRKQLSSPKFWQQVQHTLVPGLTALVATTRTKPPTSDESLNELHLVRALATRTCADPLCLNIRGCSEGRLRSRQCSGCGLARYCCRSCQVDDGRHRKVCQQLAALGEAGS